MTRELERVPERLHKYLARCGVASRRSAERMISEGRIAVNNVRVQEPGTKVVPGKDLVTVDGKLTEPAASVSYYLFYKPSGVVTTMHDPQGRRSVGDYARTVEGRLFPVGRLDYDAEGALLLTDDGDLAQRLTHPRYHVPRTYLAKVKGVPAQATLDKLRAGVRLEDGPAKPLSVEIFEAAELNTWLKIRISEGRHHIIKRMCAAIGHPVVRLYRPSYAGLGLSGLKPGAMRPLRAEEVAAVQEIAAGTRPLEEPMLRLPPRRHGKASSSESEAEGLADLPVQRPEKDPGVKPRGAGGGRRTSSARQSSSANGARRPTRAPAPVPLSSSGTPESGSSEPKRAWGPKPRRPSGGFKRGRPAAAQRFESRAEEAPRARGKRPPATRGKHSAGRDAFGASRGSAKGRGGGRPASSPGKKGPTSRKPSRSKLSPPRRGR